VQVVSQIVCTSRASVAIKYTEKADLGPFNFDVGLVLGLKDVENDTHSVFVIVTDDSLVCVGCI